jgi:hypothetical protein
MRKTIKKRIPISDNVWNKILEKFGCSVNQVGFHSLSWNLHERQDWSSESCAQIVQELSGGQGVKQ